MALRSTLPQIEWRSVARGGLVTLLIAVPPSIVGAVLADDDGLADSNWSLGVILVIVGGFVIGGFLAAARQAHAPLAHGALAASSAYALVRLAGVVRRLVADDPMGLLGLLFGLLLAAAGGAVGGLLADRRRNRRPSGDPSASAGVEP